MMQVKSYYDSDQNDDKMDQNYDDSRLIFFFNEKFYNTYREVVFMISQDLKFSDISFCNYARLGVHLPDLHKPGDVF